MAFFQIVYVFRTPDAGWEEIFYDEAASIDTFAGPTPQEIEAMANFRGTGATLLGTKVIEEGGLRRAKAFPLNHPSSHGGLTGAKGVAGVSAKVKLNFSGGGSRTWNVRGIADIDELPSSSGPSLQSAFLAGRLIDAVNFIKTPANPFLGKRLKPVSVVPWKDAISMQADPANDNWTEVTISTLAVAIPNGTIVYFQGIDPLQIPWVKGKYRTVGATTVTKFSIPTKFRATESPLALRNVQWRQAEYDYPAITGGGFLRFGTRDTAGPFGESRGRRSSQKTR